MLTSLNWIKQYIDTDLTAEEISEILTAIGLEVEGMETVESIQGGLRGVVIGEVKECGKHPNADRLSVTKVDIGDGRLRDIVCGAPNVAAGQKVVVATEGTELYNAEGKAFTIKKGKIRGEVSEGMICAEDELGLGNSHDGIMVLPDSTQVGTSAANYFNVESDIVYEIGLTPNRSDATCHLGVAKDLLAYLKINHNHSGDITLPDVSAFTAGNSHKSIEVVIQNTEACPRYAGILLENIEIKESPDWLKNKLKAVGVRPISNIVDITNYVLHELGQPLHAFDADKIAERKVIVKTLPEGTTFRTLDEVDRTLTNRDLIICDGASKGMCIGGIFGGIGSGVTENTTSIFLESAHFNASWIRKSSMHHILRTDAAKVFEKGSDPNICVFALKRAALLMQEFAGATIASDIIDIYPQPVQPVEIAITYRNINRLIGADITTDEMKDILTAMEMEITGEDASGLTIAVPTNKADVVREVDVIEEILRIYGFNKVAMPKYIKSALVTSPQPDPVVLRNTIGGMLAAAGFHEMMALSLSQSKYYGGDVENLVYINNTSNIHLDIMRPDMLHSALETIAHNQNRQQNDLRLFEFGRTYCYNEENIEEQTHLSIVLTGAQEAESWHRDQQKPVSYFSLKGIIEAVLSRLGIEKYQQTTIDHHDLQFSMQYHRGNQILVSFGKVQKNHLKTFGIKQPVFFADFNWDNLLKAVKKHKIIFEELNKYPTTRRDLALVVEKTVQFQQISDIVKKTGKKIVSGINLFDVYENKEQLGENRKSYAISITFADSNKTLKDKDVDKVMQQVMQNCEKDLGAEVRK